jgi:hypothetical protein
VAREQHRVLRDEQSGRPERRGIETRSRFAEQIPSPSERIAEQPGQELKARREAVAVHGAADDIHRGIDVLSWTGTPNPTGAQAPVASSGVATNLSLLGVAGILLPIAALVGRRRRAAGGEVTSAG